MDVISSEIENSKKIPTKHLQIKKIDYLCAPKMWRDLTACNHLKKC
jgi:hypothetical protein